MATGSLYGTSTETTGLYGNTTSFGGTYFEWFIFQVSETQPATPTGGTWDFTTNANTPPTGWSSTPPANPSFTVWVSIAIVNSRNTAPLVWSVPGKFAYASGLPILSGNVTPDPGLGQTDQLYIQLNTTPQTIWFKEAGTWTRITGSTLYADLTSNQTIAGTKTFSSQIQGSISGTASNVTGTVAITNGGTGSTTAGSARAALGAAASGANSDITSLTGLTTALSVPQGGTGATSFTSGYFLVGGGTSAVTATNSISGTAISGNISGNAANVTGVVAVANGGTNATTAPLARASLSAAASGANTDITSLGGLTTALSIGQGGTSATTAPLARAALGATTKLTGTLDFSSTTVASVNHGLGTWVTAQSFDGSGFLIDMDVQNTSTSGGTTIYTVSATSATATNFTYVIVG
jgi:hypothetical protein